MSKNTLTEDRLAKINALKSELEELINLYNQAFTGKQSLTRQNEVVSKILKRLVNVQESALKIRDYNAQVLSQRQLDLKAQKLRQIEVSLHQLNSVMQSVNSVMAIDSDSSDHTLAIDNTNYSGEIKSSMPDESEKADNDSEDGDDKNFSQPGENPVTNPSSNEEYDNKIDDDAAVDDSSDDDKSDQEYRDAERQLREAQAKMAKARAAREAQQKSSVAKESVKTRNESEQADDHEAELQSSAYQKSQAQIKRHAAKVVSSDVNSVPIRDTDDSETLRAQAEFESHKKWAEQHPKEIKKRKQKGKQSLHSGLAINWPGTKDFIDRYGHVVKPDNLSVRDVTPDGIADRTTKENHQDQNEAEDALNKEMDKLNF